MMSFFPRFFFSAASCYSSNLSHITNVLTRFPLTHLPSFTNSPSQNSPAFTFSPSSLLTLTQSPLRPSSALHQEQQNEKKNPKTPDHRHFFYSAPIHPLFHPFFLDILRLNNNHKPRTRTPSQVAFNSKLVRGADWVGEMSPGEGEKGIYQEEL